MTLTRYGDHVAEKPRIRGAAVRVINTRDSAHVAFLCRRLLKRCVVLLFCQLLAARFHPAECQGAASQPPPTAGENPSPCAACPRRLSPLVCSMGGRWFQGWVETKRRPLVRELATGSIGHGRCRSKAGPKIPQIPQYPPLPRDVTSSGRVASRGTTFTHATGFPPTVSQNNAARECAKYR